MEDPPEPYIFISPQDFKGPSGDIIMSVKNNDLPRNS